MEILFLDLSSPVRFDEFIGPSNVFIFDSTGQQNLGLSSRLNNQALNQAVADRVFQYRRGKMIDAPVYKLL